MWEGDGVSNSCRFALGSALGLRGTLLASVSCSLLGTSGKILARTLSKLFNLTSSSPS